MLCLNLGSDSSDTVFARYRVKSKELTENLRAETTGNLSDSFVPNLSNVYTSVEELKKRVIKLTKRLVDRQEEYSAGKKILADQLRETIAEKQKIEKAVEHWRAECNTVELELRRMEEDRDQFQVQCTRLQLQLSLSSYRDDSAGEVEILKSHLEKLNGELIETQARLAVYCPLHVISSFYITSSFLFVKIFELHSAAQDSTAGLWHLFFSLGTSLS
eukprot:m.304635 g.304635  ORF g.304635 m.304635 type:complete len:217 (-) comp55273_c1_seq3:56-706(-)